MVIDTTPVRDHINTTINEHDPWGSLVEFEWFPEDKGDTPTSDPEEGTVSRIKAGSSELNGFFLRGVNKLHEYHLENCRIKSPPAQDLTPSVYKALGQAIKWLHQRRCEDVFERCAGYLMLCGSEKDPHYAEFPYREKLTDIGAPKNLPPMSYGDLESLWTRLSRTAPLEYAHGHTGRKPQFGLVIGPDPAAASRHPGFIYHVVPQPPRYTEVEGHLVRVEPVTEKGSYNPEYDKAPIEVAYAMAKRVFTFQVPGREDGVEPRDRAVTTSWVQLEEEEDGFVMVTMANAAKPMMVDFGYMVLYRRAGR